MSCIKATKEYGYCEGCFGGYLLELISVPHNLLIRLIANFEKILH